ncbi:hypothetical protein FXB41_36585 [Bradyrhizobium canariense]|nr:hypothetical protein [Bradyrhizobium canariense]
MVPRHAHNRQSTHDWKNVLDRARFGASGRTFWEDAAMVWADRLRKATVEAPLQSLALAFVLGMWFARRR